MKCPADGEVLVMSERSGVEIDYCPTCRGVWLDRGELDKILDRAANETPTQPAQPDPTPPPVQPQAPQPNPAYGSPFDDGPPPAPAPHPGPGGGFAVPGFGGARYDDRYDDRRRDPRYRKRKKKEGFLEDLFDF